MRRFLLALLAAPILACGGDSATAPEPPFPSVVGVYSISGDFSGGGSPFQGTITFVQPSRDQPTLTGSCALSVYLSTGVVNFTTIDAASVSQSGVIGFNVGSAGGTATWRFTGALANGTITGSHNLSGSYGTFLGTFTAFKQ